MLTLLRPDADPAPEAAPATRPSLRVPTGAAWLLAEAIDLANRFGCRVVEAELDGEPSGVRWSREGRRLWIDLGDSPDERLTAIADALRGEPWLAFAEMSPELAAYLAPRRAA